MPRFASRKPWFVDEYLTWREVTYAFCFYHSADLDTLKVRGWSGRVPLSGRLMHAAHLLAMRHVVEDFLALPGLASASALPA